MGTGAKVLVGLLFVGLVAVVAVLYSQIARVEADAGVRVAAEGQRAQVCEAETQRLQAELAQLKEQLAKAQEGAAAMQLDPSLLNLAPRVKSGGGGGKLPMDAVVKVVNNGKGALQRCYESALKRNSALQVQQLRVTLGFTVQPTGRASGVNVSPNYDSQMADCVREAVDRWRFPPFNGSAQPVEAPVTLVPKNN